MNNTVLEYLEGYFGGELNESITDDNITDAFYKLLETANAVEDYLQEFVGIGHADSARMRGSAVPPRKPGEKMGGMETHGPKRKPGEKPRLRVQPMYNKYGKRKYTE